MCYILYMGNKKQNQILKEGGKQIMEKVIVAKITHDNESYVGKRRVELYEGNDQMTADANVGLTLRTQRQIRDALKVKNGLKTISSGGADIDLSNIDEV